MARPQKSRRVCRVPENKLFGALSKYDQIDVNQVTLVTVEEYEVMRLLDLMDLTQEECAIRMNVSRTSVQRLYTNARKKIADFFVNGKILKIEGGNYQECAGENVEYCGGKCFKHC